MLEIKDLHVNYGAVHALNGVSMTVKDGEIVSLIGANGAGKTTTLRTITGLEKAAAPHQSAGKPLTASPDGGSLSFRNIPRMPERHHTRAVSGGKGITMSEIIRVENLSYI